MNKKAIEYKSLGKKYKGKFLDGHSFAWIDDYGFVHWITDDHAYYAMHELDKRDQLDPEYGFEYANYDMMKNGWVKASNFQDFAYHSDPWIDNRDALSSTVKLAIEGSLLQGIDPTSPEFNVIEVYDYNYENMYPESIRRTYSLDELIQKWGNRDMADYYYSQLLSKNPKSSTHNILSVLGIGIAIGLLSK